MARFAPWRPARGVEYRNYRTPTGDDPVSNEWDPADREAAYVSLCEALTKVGPDHEVHFLARLALLLAEELSDSSAFARALAAALLEAGDVNGPRPAS
jgi:hypothetical protein